MAGREADVRRWRWDAVPGSQLIVAWRWGRVAWAATGAARVRGRSSVVPGFLLGFSE
jgi:hypothetical protein